LQQLQQQQGVNRCRTSSYCTLLASRMRLIVAISLRTFGSVGTEVEYSTTLCSDIARPHLHLL
jgi:hypothetical protein